VTAREYFDGVRRSQALVDLYALRLDEAEARLDGLGAAPACGGRSAPQADPFARRVARLDSVRARMCDAIDRAAAAEDEACEVLARLDHGNDLTTARWRRCVALVYLYGRTPAQAAKEQDVTESGVRYACDSAFEWLDEHGTLAAMGLA
jgi:DNA-directed RNA polymerase specialized sigma24 family protein